MSHDQDDYIGYLMTDTARLLRTVFERRVRARGLTRAQWVVIARLHQRPGLSQSEVADILEIEKASAGRLIDRMEAKGWLERRSDPNDRRINRLHLTGDALRLHQEIWPVAEATVADALTGLTPRQQSELGKLLGAVKQTLQGLTTNDPVVVGHSTDASGGAVAARRGAKKSRSTPTGGADAEDSESDAAVAV